MIRNGVKQSNAPAKAVAVILISFIVWKVCYASADAPDKGEDALDSKLGEIGTPFMRMGLVRIAREDEEIEDPITDADRREATIHSVSDPEARPSPGG